MDKWVKPVAAVAIICLLALVVYNMLDNDGVKMSEGKYKKVLLIGIDGMDPKITKKLMDDGLIPNFARFNEEGRFTTLGTSLPPQSPVAWTSIATGSNPGKHNVFDFIGRDPNSHLPQLSLSKTASGIGGTEYSSIVTADPFWRITTKAGLDTTIIRWPVSFPPERIQGNLLSGLGVPDVRGFLSGYAYYTSEEIIKGADGSDKSVKVAYSDAIDTVISGPRKFEGGQVKSITTPMKVTLDKAGNKASVVVEGTGYNVDVGGWSEWITVKFKVGFMNEVSGICKVYLESVEPEFNMYLTTIQIDPENPVFDISAPKSYSGDLAKEIGLYYTLGMPEDTDALNDKKISNKVFLEQISDIEDQREKMFWIEFNKFKDSSSGLMAFVYDSSDRMQHMFWDQEVLQNKEEGLKISQEVIDYYVKKDAFLGKVLEEVDNDTALIIISDHGFTSFERAVTVNTWLARNGFLTLTEEIVDGDENGLFMHVDWSKTKAYSVGFNSIFINLEGREAKGIVKESEKAALVEEISKGLVELEDKKYGGTVITKMYKGEDIYNGPQSGNGPDLVVGFKPGYRMSWQNAVGGFTQDIIFDNVKQWDGDHLVDPAYVPGVLFTSFDVSKDKPHQMDIAPTVLSLLGIEVPESIDGEALA